MALRSERYTLIPADLRHPPSEIFGPLLEDGTLKRNLPTLFISECVFAYMPPSASESIIQWFSDSFDIAGGVLYEMFGLEDSFGQIMRRNLMVTHFHYVFHYPRHLSRLLSYWFQ
jgi:[phosphatase 2A protein]-leucine-carboxy methyltransferase